MLGTGPVDLVDFLGVGIVSVESPELALDVTEEQKEVRTIAPVDHVLLSKNTSVKKATNFHLCKKYVWGGGEGDENRPH